MNRLGILAVSLIVMTAACGGDGDGPVETTVQTAEPSATDGAAASGAPDDVTTTTSGETATSPPQGNVDAGTCMVSVSGDVEESWTFEQNPTSFSSDYWLSEETLREIAAEFDEDYDELVAAGKPALLLFQVACQDASDNLTGVLFTQANEATTNDVPMGPGTYPISDSLLGDVPTEFGASFAPNGDDLFAAVPGTGAVEITHWDTTRIEGSAAFDAVERFADSPREVHVELTFRYVCTDFYTGC